ncbi:hypothetical protein GCM10025865_01510 [Paraoerskovia sediminicola]|uniref:Metal-dependent hydrolase n=1 Tax=Paraoerskovia sediminicola TaxID=1138587 RepID=A0ABN6X7Y7_9CELL|nr:hypothetical protein GCM10025865_01510 [Paraoerskovia sediminicola]
MRLVTVGCAGSFAGPDSPASCHLVRVPDDVSPDGREWNVALDLGNGALGALQRHVDPLALDGVAISHLHPDHFVDLCGLYVYLRYHPGGGTERDGRSDAVPTPDAPGRLPVWGPSDIEARVGAAYGLAPDEHMGAEMCFRPWAPGDRIEIGPLVLEPFRVDHPLESYGVRVTGPSSVRPGRPPRSRTPATRTTARRSWRARGTWTSCSARRRSTRGATTASTPGSTSPGAARAAWRARRGQLGSSSPTSPRGTTPR